MYVIRQWGREILSFQQIGFEINKEMIGSEAEKSWVLIQNCDLIKYLK